MGRVVIFTGGGSGGHVMPGLTIIRQLQVLGEVECHYIGGRHGIERKLVGELGLKYYPIFTGKLRRYFSWENLLDLFKVTLGIIQSLLILMRYSRQNTMIFSTGGFVSLPVVIGGWLTGKEIMIHEQTACAGLANRIAARFASKVFISFERSRENFPVGKVTHSGYPVRKECYLPTPLTLQLGEAKLEGSGKPILFITGGGNGSKLLNDLIEQDLSWLTKHYLVVHQVGQNFIDHFERMQSIDYLPLAFVGREMIDLYKLASVVISRSGAGTVAELMAVGKRSIFIPLKGAQKNEQYFNAVEAHDRLGSLVVGEDELSQRNLKELLEGFSQRAGDNCNRNVTSNQPQGDDATTVLVGAIMKRLS
jgi:UDP-N-acetylglucosamine--N-acetylmuramyl-(pentapeptide) pyrophosphoryl-undecaprenol N-acetylglucosamine transferase